MARTLSLVLLLMTALPTFAQRVPIAPPIVGRPDDFSNIVGKYTIDISAEPREVPVEEPITLRLVIKGEGPAKYEPKRESLRILPDWKNDFYVENVPDEDRVHKNEKTWIFVYRLRPKHTGVTAIDGLAFVTYDPDYRGKNKFLSPPLETLKITVTPKRDLAPAIETPSAVPDSFFQIDASRHALAPAAAFSPSAISLALTLAIPPLACLIGALTWRRFRPNDAQRRARHRNQSAQRALTSLQGTGVPAWIILCRYLHERFGFDVDDPTPGDASAFLKRRGFAKERCLDAHVFFQECDAVRFTDRSADANTLNDEAARLVHMLEADPCAR